MAGWQPTARTALAARTATGEKGFGTAGQAGGAQAINCVRQDVNHADSLEARVRTGAL